MLVRLAVWSGGVVVLKPFKAQLGTHVPKDDRCHLSVDAIDDAHTLKTFDPY